MSNMDIQKIAKAETPKQLFTLIENEITAFSDLSYLGIFVLNDQETEYVLEKEIRRVQYKVNASLGLKDPIIVHLVNTKKTIKTSAIAEEAAFVLTQNRSPTLNTLLKKLNQLKVEMCVPGFVKDKLVTVFVLGEKISKKEFSEQEKNLFSILTEKSARILFDFGLLRKNVKLFAKSIREINDILEKKDPYRKGHANRVAQFSMIIGQKLSDEIKRIPHGEEVLYYASLLCDAGKINIPDSVLQKETDLTEEEYNKVKKHPLESVRIISQMEKWLGKAIVDAVLHHHENYDGTGYPDGLKADQINILSKIIRVVDSFDDMITARQNRPALTHHRALSKLKKGRGTLFDPNVVDAFLEAYRQGLFKYIFFPQLKGEDTNEIYRP